MFYPFLCKRKTVKCVYEHGLILKIPGAKKTKQKTKQNKDVNKQLCTLMRMNQPFSSKEASLVPYK